MRLNRKQKILSGLAAWFVVFWVIKCLFHKEAAARLIVPVVVALAFYFMLLFLLRSEKPSASHLNK
jgi:hypothetical protein